MNATQLPFHDRRHAGRVLAEALEAYRARPNLRVLGLARGGVPVAFEVAHALGALLDVFVVRKIGFPGHEEYAIGAIASGGVRVMNPLPGVTASPDAVGAVVAREEAELTRREQFYRGTRPAVSVAGCTVIVVDDGLATGATMQAAVIALRQQRPLHLAVAAPAGASDACERLRQRADALVCVATPEPFEGVGLWYEDFAPTSDAQVNALVDEARRMRAARR